MSTNISHRARERRLRAKYRRQSVMIGIITLLLGVGLGYLICVLTSEAPTVEPAATPAPAFITNAPESEATVAAAEAVATQSIEITTEAPVAGATQAPVVAAATEAPAVAGATEVPAADGAANVPAVVSATDVTGVAAPAQVVASATVEPTPTAEPTPEPTKAPVIVPYGESVTFETQIKEDGTARLVPDVDPFETLSFTMKVDAYRDPAYFAEQYAESYSLSGTEAAVEFDLTLNGYTGDKDIVPQNVLLITFTSEDSAVSTQGYQLMDSEIAGNINVSVTSDKTAKLYKRYPYDADQGDMYYMVVNAYNNGLPEAYWFEIIAPEKPAGEEDATGETLKVGSSGDAVTKLQKKLIAMDLLSGEADGDFGNYTAEAVKAAQKKLDMEQTGEADPAFLKKLYDTED